MTKEIYKYLKIPYEVSECKNICSTAKLLYGRLLLLEYKHGYIHASNNYLATIFNMSERIAQYVRSIYWYIYLVIMRFFCTIINNYRHFFKFLYS